MPMFLDEAAVCERLQMGELIRAIAKCLAELWRGKVAQPLRAIISVADHGGFFGSMPAYGVGALGAKLVTFYPNNKEVPTHNGMILLFDPKTGLPLVTMDGRLITEMRTAAASAVATEQLARRDSPVLAILGSGVQARSHLEAMRLVREFHEVRVWSPRSAAQFAREFGVKAVETAEEAVRGADVIVVATSSKTPVLRGDWLGPGMHINAVGATRFDWRELDDAALARATIYVDSREAASKESGDIIAAGSVFAEIGEVINGTKPGRTSDEQVTLFKSVGVAIEDIVAADLVYRNSKETIPEWCVVGTGPHRTVRPLPSSIRGGALPRRRCRPQTRAFSSSAPTIAPQSRRHVSAPSPSPAGGPDKSGDKLRMTSKCLINRLG